MAVQNPKASFLAVPIEDTPASVPPVLSPRASFVAILLADSVSLNLPKNQRVEPNVEYGFSGLEQIGSLSSGGFRRGAF